MPASIVGVRCCNSSSDFRPADAKDVRANLLPHCWVAGTPRVEVRRRELGIRCLEISKLVACLPRPSPSSVAGAALWQRRIPKLFVEGANAVISFENARR